MSARLQRIESRNRDLTKRVLNSFSRDMKRLTVAFSRSALNSSAL